MDFVTLQKFVHRAIDSLHAHDETLFNNGADEWSIAHRLAVYLEREIPGWDVDCEYNRQGEDGEVKTNAETGGATDRTRPDIILHRRGELARESNLLLAELKLWQVADDAKVRESTRPPAGTRLYQYEFGLAITFLPALDLRWYSNGERVL